MSEPTTSTSTTERVRLRRLEVHNYRAIEIAVFDIMPGVNEIFGIPAQGKSTLPLSVMELLKRGGVSSKPLRTGAGEGLIHAEFSDGTVAEKAITPKGAKPTRVTMPDGRKTGIEEMQGWITDDIFDPLKFGSLSDSKPGRRAQAEIVAELSGLDTSAIDEERAKALAAESAAGKAADELEAQARGVVVPDAVEAPGKLIDLADVAGKKAEIEREIAANNRVRESVKPLDEAAKRATTARERAGDEVEELGRQLAAAEDRLAKAMLAERDAAEAALQAKEKAEALRDPDPSDVDAEITRARAHNAAVDAAVLKNAERARKIEERAAIEKRAKAKRDEERQHALVKRDLDARRAHAIAKAAERMPIDGLTIEGAGADRELYLKGEPLSQASTKERMALGCAIALARNPKLGLLWIDYGNELDEATLNWLQGFLEEHNADAFVVHVVADPADVESKDGLQIVAGKVATDKRKTRKAPVKNTVTGPAQLTAAGREKLEAAGIAASGGAVLTPDDSPPEDF